MKQDRTARIILAALAAIALNNLPVTGAEAPNLYCRATQAPLVAPPRQGLARPDSGLGDLWPAEVVFYPAANGWPGPSMRPPLTFRKQPGR
jgi:hypothetical protein